MWTTDISRVQRLFIQHLADVAVHVWLNAVLSLGGCAGKISCPVFIYITHRNEVEDVNSLILEIDIGVQMRPRHPTTTNNSKSYFICLHGHSLFDNGVVFQK